LLISVDGNNTKEIISMGSIVQETSMSTTKRTIQKIVYKFYMVLLYEIGICVGRFCLLIALLMRMRYFTLRSASFMSI